MVLCLLVSGAGCKDKGGGEPEESDRVYTDEAFTCSCYCDPDADVLGDSVTIDVNDICLPEDIEAADYCRDVVCPAVEIFFEQTIVDNRPLPTTSCDVSCTVGSTNDRGLDVSVTGGVSRVHGAPECADGCDPILCEKLYTSDYEVEFDNSDCCTYADTTCGSGATSDVFCRSTAGECLPGPSPPPSAPTSPGAGPTHDADMRERRTAADWALGVPAVEPRQAVADSATRCRAGSGKFLLVPVREYDRSPDPQKIAAVAPVQIDGSGRLTDSAWITDIDTSATGFDEIVASRPGGRAFIDQRDIIKGDASNVIRMAPGRRHLAIGELGGGAGFAVRFAVPWVGPVAVSMSWECASPSSKNMQRNGSEPDALVTPGSLSPPNGWMTYVDNSSPIDGAKPGIKFNRPIPKRPETKAHAYSFTLPQIGCSVSWPQEFTLFVDTAAMPARATVVLSGQSTESVTVILGHAKRGEGLDLSYNKDGLVLSAELLQTSESSAAIAIVHAEYLGVPLCAPGTYYIMASTQ